MIINLPKLILFMSIIISSTGVSADSIRIELEKHRQNTDDGSITVNMTNISEDDIRVLKWNTPFEDTLNANTFNVQNSGETVPYMGRMVKRGAPAEEDYMLLQQGETRSATVTLPQFYQMQKTGNYTVSYTGSISLQSEDLNGNIRQKFKADKQSIELFYSPSEKKNKFFQKIPANFNGCTESEVNILNTAHNEAVNLAEEASNAMNEASANTNAVRYTTWFGKANSTRQSVVKTHFNKIHSALDSQNIVFDCSTCRGSDYEKAYAYVYPSRAYTVYLCDSFWSTGITGTDSQAGTLIHEISHFTAVAATNDNAYGQTDAKQLAVSDPTKAVNNAENYEYFSENSPFLSMAEIINATRNIDILENLPLTDSIVSSAEKDNFSFIAPFSGEFTFYSTGTLDTKGALYNSSNELLVSNDDADDRNFSVSHALVEGERYFIEVSGYRTSTGSYTLNVDVSEKIIVNILTELPFSGSITSGEKDKFFFIAPFSGEFTFYTSGSLDTLGTLYNVDTLLASNDNGGDDRNFSVTYTLTEGERYHLEVRSFQPATGAYTLSVRTPENTINNLLTDFPLSGSIGYSGEKDYFYFIAPLSGEFTFYSTGSLDTLGALYNRNNADESLASNDDVDFSNQNYNFSLTHTLIEGAEYYLEISGYKTQTGQYVINLIAPGDSETISINLLTGLPLTDSIDSSDEKDIFFFTTPFAGEFTFYTTGLLDTQGDLYIASNFDESLASNDDAGPARNFSVTYFLSGRRKYRLEISGYNTATGTYTLNVTTPEKPISNILADLPLSSTIASGERDIFSFFAPSTGEFTFYTTGYRDTTGDLYNRNNANELLASNDDAGLARNFSITHTLLKGEEYYLKIGVFLSRAGPYTLNLIAPTENENDLENFVSRFYREVLNRQAETEGLNGWTNRLSSGQSVGEDIAWGFIFSSEFINRQTDDDLFVTILYKAFFDRTPDSSGFNRWVSKLSQGDTRSAVLDGFLHSLEFSNLSQKFGIQATRGIREFVQRFYQEILGREAEDLGLNDWIGRLTSLQSTGADIARGFIFSNEYRNKNTENVVFVTTLYKAFFDRTPDNVGLETWMDALNRGDTRFNVLNGFLYSQEFAVLSNSYGIIAVE